MVVEALNPLDLFDAESDLSVISEYAVALRKKVLMHKILLAQSELLELEAKRLGLTVVTKVIAEELTVHEALSLYHTWLAELGRHSQEVGSRVTPPELHVPPEDRVRTVAAKP